MHHDKARYLLYWDKAKFQKRVSIGPECYQKCKSDNQCGCVHWIPQSLYIQNKDDVEYLLKFENLSNDIKKLNDLGILPPVTMEHQRKSKPKKNLALTPLVIKFVDEMYKNDFLLWESAGIADNKC